MIIRHKQCLLFFSFCLTIVTDAQKKIIDVYLLAGQSNATGQGYMANLLPSQTIDTSVWIYHSGRPHLEGAGAPFQLHPLKQASESPDRFGAELGFGKRMRELFPQQNIAIIKHAHSGTNLFNEWKPGKKNSDSTDWGEQYKAFVGTVTGGLAALKKAGYTPVIKAIFWQQGESDAKLTETADQYAQNLRHFIKRVRQQFHTKNMLFIYGYVLSAHFEYPGRDAVRKAEKDIDQDSGSPLSVKKAYVVFTDDLSLRANDKNSKYPNDKLHLGTQGNWDLGTRMADMYFKHWKK